MERFFSIVAIGILSLTGIAFASAAERGDSNNSSDVGADMNYAQVIYVEAFQSDDGSWCINTVVHHNDEGWDHYANAWQVLDEENKELAWRLLAHPHDDEQPFKRGICSVNIPPDVKRLRVRAKCKVHGFGGQEVLVDMSVAEGEGFKVKRK